MKNLVELNEKYNKNWAAYIDRKNKLDIKIIRLQTKKKRLGFNSRLIKLFKPFAEQLSKKFNSDSYEWYGPFGLDCEQTIYFKKNKEEDITKKGNVLGSICFVSSFGWGYAIKNEKINTKKYANGTLAEINGMNHPTIKFTEKMDINWLYRWAKRNK